MNKIKKQRRKVGDILKIDLRDGTFSYGHVSVDPCIVFYGGRFAKDLELSEIIKLPEIFNLSVSNYAIKNGIWPVVGFSEIPKEKQKKPYRFKQDAITGKLSIYHPDFIDTNYERPAALAECEGLECAAVWDVNHVVDRLIDYFEGRPNKWVLQLAIDKSKVK